ncbi:mCG1032889 [Mus musculus]|nr:mCG1032889 [Mus musculus]
MCSTELTAKDKYSSHPSPEKPPVCRRWRRLQKSTRAEFFSVPNSNQYIYNQPLDPRLRGHHGRRARKTVKARGLGHLL